MVRKLHMVVGYGFVSGSYGIDYGFIGSYCLDRAAMSETYGFRTRKL